MLDLYLIRHAECEMNRVVHSKIGGRSNSSPLSEIGKYQARLLGERFKAEGIKFDEVYSSPAERTKETIRIVAEIIGFPLEKIVQSENFLELDQGDWEGRPRETTYTPEILAQINLDNWNFAAPNGESQRQVEERMLKEIEENLVKRYKEDLTVAISGHGVAIKCWLRGIMDFNPEITYKISLDNTSITRLKYTDKGWFPITINDFGHLMGKC